MRSMHKCLKNLTFHICSSISKCPKSVHVLIASGNVAAQVPYDDLKNEWYLMQQLLFILFSVSLAK